VRRKVRLSGLGLLRFRSRVLNVGRGMDPVSLERCTEGPAGMQMSLTRFAATHKAEKVFGFRQRHSGWIQIELKVASYESR
jgi:hypothetical protein